MSNAVIVSHRTDEQLELYAFGRLSEPETAAVEEHLLLCSVCREQLDDLECYAIVMRRAISVETDREPFGIFWLQRWLPKKPILVPACGVALFLLASTVHLPSEPHAAALTALELAATRGAVPSVGLSRETDVTLTDALFRSSLRAEVIDSAGATLWNELLNPQTHRIALTRQFAPGNYYVRLFDSSGKLLNEYGFRVLASQ